MRMLLLTALALAVAGCGGRRAHLVTGGCRGSALRASFSLIPGSPGAGNVVYALRLQNRSGTRCVVARVRKAQLYGRRGGRLPTRVVPAVPGATTAPRVVLAPQGWATASARFSPDVPGPGEQHAGPCEPTAYRLRITAPGGSGTTVAAVKPPTAVCEHGTLSLTALVAGRTPPRG